MPAEDLDSKEGFKIWSRIQEAKVCSRCGQKMNSKGLSFFNDEILCAECKEKEKKLPEYAMTAKNICDEAKAELKKSRKRSLKS